ncbi:MAG: hypothetical protein GY850_06120 [bacterium]|nr:hypothetical protein [bacterium]
MTTQWNLKPFLQIWKSIFIVRMKSSKIISHLSRRELHAMAETGGIEKAGKESMAHLSGCPVCLHEWAEWRRAISTVEGLEEEDDEDDEQMPFSVSHGMLEAAATEGKKRSLRLNSKCGKYTLGLNLQMDDPGRGMITLEAATAEGVSVEDRQVTVRDRNGLVLVKGRLRNGRLARVHDNISEIDLTTWTVFLKNEEEIA